MPKKNTIDDLFSKVQVQPNGCWIFTGALNTGGYGQFRWNGRNDVAHRVSYSTQVKEIPIGMLVCHTCDNRPCINPNHLFIGTEKNNTDDMMSKGRNFVATGSKHGQAKLNEDTVVQIKLILATGNYTNKEIGDKFGVERKTISDIALGKTWRHVQMPNLYGCKRNGDQYRITKFDAESMNVESSYLCTIEECECPAGVRPICRHREMLPKFIHRNYVNTGFLFDYDRGGWVDFRQDDEMEPHSQEVKAADFDSAIVGSNPAGATNITANEIDERIKNLPPIKNQVVEELVDIVHKTIVKPYRKPNDGRRV